MSRFLSLMLGRCTHRNQSRVFTIARRTYKVCLDCGEEINYCWASMRPVRKEEVA